MISIVHAMEKKTEEIFTKNIHQKLNANILYEIWYTTGNKHIRVHTECHSLTLAQKESKMQRNSAIL